MWESVEAINFVKVNKLSDVEERPGLYKIVNKSEPDKIYIGNAFINLRSALTVNNFLVVFSPVEKVPYYLSLPLLF